MPNIALSSRLSGIGEYYFSQKLREIDELNKQGKNIISLGIGSPDLPPHADVIKTLTEEAAKPNAHAYQSYKGSPVLRKAMSDWYKTWYRTELNPDTEILPLIGSKEGIVHICMTYLNEGDEVLVPNPGYPTYTSAVKLAGAKVRAYTLSADNNWQPDFNSLAAAGLKKVKLMFVNYPHMPTGQLPSKKFFEQLVAFAKANNILLVHDNPYSFILNESPMSLLEVPGAKERIDEVLRFKSNMDSGMFLPLQLAAAKALSLGKDWYDSINAIYRQRREKVFSLLDTLGCTYSKEQVGMFVWAKIPAGYKDGYALSDEVLYNANVFITPGGIFGDAGNGYVRVSLCCAEEKIDQSIQRIKACLVK
jgi:aspartate/methionine/tyrosine aminotransferase